MRALVGGLLTDGEFGIALMLVTVTMIVTPLMAKAGDSLAKRFGAATPEADVDQPISGGLKGHVVIAGYGRGGRTIGVMLEKRDIPFISFDIDSDSVALGRKRGHNVYFGDMTNPEILRGAGSGGSARDCRNGGRP